MTAATSTSPAAPVLVDTDCGEFGDDGSELVIVARSPRQLRLIAVTSVSGNVWAGEAAAFARRAIEAAGLDAIPVYPGAALPLIRNGAMVRVAGQRWGDNGYRGAFDRPMIAWGDASAAIQALIHAVDGHQDKLTILALGPMTNLAIALRLRPDLEGRIGRLVFMGGNVHVPGNTTQSAEFNFWFDPEAAAVVLRSAIREKVMFALDISNKAPLTRVLFDRIVAADTPVTALFRRDYGERYPGFLRDCNATGYLWDELAAAYLVDPGFVTGEKREYLDVETTFGERYGAVIPLDRRLAPDATAVRVMTDLDLERVTTLLVAKLTAR